MRQNALNFPYKIDDVPGLIFQTTIWNNGGLFVEMIDRFRFDGYVGPVDIDADDAQDATCNDCGRHLGWDVGGETRFFGYCDLCAFNHIKYSVIRPKPEVEKK